MIFVQNMVFSECEKYFYFNITFTFIPTGMHSYPGRLDSSKLCRISISQGSICLCVFEEWNV
jgi:hypothetical protein